MSTRGMYGIRKNGTDKATYNHFSSDPSHLGAKVIDFVKNMSDAELCLFYDNIVLVDGDDIPSETDIEALRDSGQYDGQYQKSPWRDWIRNSQGNFQMYESVVRSGKKVFMVDGRDFIKDSLYCEYAYIINLDTMRLEFWKGNQKMPQEGNRYGTEPIMIRGSLSLTFYPCLMAAAYSLDDIRNIPTDDILGMAAKNMEDEE